MQVVAQRTITGTVVDDTNMVVPGVNVVVKGTTLGTATDIDGNYTIKVPENAKTLVFSFLGYTTSEQEIGGNNSINVTLVEDAVGLDEVIVTALGISKRDKTIGSSIQAVKGDDLIKARESNLINTLSGKIAGVQINNSSGAVGSSSRIVVALQHLLPATVILYLLLMVFLLIIQIMERVTTAVDLIHPMV
ncbi:MAG: carboxypeptidase-like regulatory domain-containing protein [Sphingobacteriales bacterium]|nr:carboxypeptidase-like regulatory domain-containing protein [Sphingobacteriales bacterium]